MVVVARPGQLTMGSPATESRAILAEAAHTRLIDRSFAIGAHEVTVAQFACYRPQFDHFIGNLSDPDCPANKISLFDEFPILPMADRSRGNDRGPAVLSGRDRSLDEVAGQLPLPDRLPTAHRSRMGNSASEPVPPRAVSSARTRHS